MDDTRCGIASRAAIRRTIFVELFTQRRVSLPKIDGMDPARFLITAYEWPGW